MIDIAKGTCSTMRPTSAAGLSIWSAAQARQPAAENWLRREGSLGAAASGRAIVAATYDYLDENCVLLFQVVRFEPKDFRPRRPDGGVSLIWRASGVSSTAARIRRAVADGRNVYVCEGEKDADNVRDRLRDDHKCGWGQ